MTVVLATFACVLALAAAVSVALVWLTLTARASDLGTRLQRLGDEIASMRATSSPQLRAEVDALAGALEKFQTTHRREMGSLWARMRGEPVANGETEAGDSDLQELLALQNAGPVRP